jgi:hypothetical protein
MNWKSKFSISKIANRSSYEGNPLQIYEVESKRGEMISRRDMIKMINEKFLPAFRGKYVDGLVSITIRHPSRWYSSDASYLHDDPNIFTADDYDDFDQDPDEYIAFRVSFLPMNQAHDAGGSDPHNDCLINCIKKFFYGNNSQWFFQAEVLKEMLKIGRDDPINITKIPDVETYMNDVISNGYNTKERSKFSSKENFEPTSQRKKRFFCKFNIFLSFIFYNYIFNCLRDLFTH